MELKRQQENFIDITSHEMRNPLSAILQCADEISTLLGDFRSSGSESIDAGIVADSIDAAQTIALCAQHQKRIVDDVLTLSKLDSAMLMVWSPFLFRVHLLIPFVGNTSRCATPAGRAARFEDVRRRGANSRHPDGVRSDRFLQKTERGLGEN